MKSNNQKLSAVLREIYTQKAENCSKIVIYKKLGAIGYEI